MNIDANKISQNIIKYRISANLTQKQLAEKTGIHPSSISDLENFKGILPSIDTLDSIAEALNISIDKLIFDNLSVFKNDDFDETTKEINKELQFMEIDKLQFLSIMLFEYDSHKRKKN